MDQIYVYLTRFCVRVLCVCPPEWRVLYVVMSSFLALILVLMISWSLLCCCRR